MAERDHKDLLSRTQDLSLSFIQHFIEHEDPWFIKDSSGRYVLTSYSFCSLYKISFNDIKGKTIFQLIDLGYRISQEHSKYECISLNNDGVVYSLEVDYFDSDVFLSARVFIVKQFKHLNENLTLTHIRKPEDINLSNIIYTRVGIRDNSSLLNRPPSKKEVIDFQSLNPTEETTAKQWEVAWLLLCGLSVAEISKVCGSSTTAVESKLNATYKKLKIFSKRDFIYIANYFHWMCYIPASFLNCQKSVLLKILYK